MQISSRASWGILRLLVVLAGPNRTKASPRVTNHYAANSSSNAFASFKSRVFKPLRKPPVNRSEQFARLLHLALIAPEACEAHSGAKFPRFCMLLACDGERMLKIALRLRAIGNWQSAGNFTGNSACLSLTPSLLCCFHRCNHFINATRRLITSAELSIGPSQVG